MDGTVIDLLPDEQLSSCPSIRTEEDQSELLTRRLLEAQSLARDTAALLELLVRMESSPDLRHACYVLVNELRDDLGCQQVAVGLRRRLAGPCTLWAISGIAQFDKRSDVTRSIESALDEAIARDGIGIWPQLDDSDRSAALTFKKLAALVESRSIIVAPLRNLQGTAVGAWIFWCDETTVGQQRAVNRIQAYEHPVATVLYLLRRLERNPLTRIIRSFCGTWSSRKWKAAMVVIALVLAALAIPLPYKIKCDCRLEPVTRRFVAAPFEGTLDTSLVKPGDLVSAGDVLAHLDGREIRWERAGLIADQNQAAKKRDAALAGHNYAEAQIAKLEMERIHLKIQLLDHRAENLEIKSPLDGIVTSGDLERAQGAPLQLGQTLFEIAPLDKMIVELSVPQDEIAHVRPGQEVIVRLDAHPGKTWNLPLNRMHPRSEIREHQNVFIGEALLGNHEATLRPGMSGRVKIVTSRHPLAWILFHKPWQSILTWLGC